jgi:hypothetical protein
MPELTVSLRKYRGEDQNELAKILAEKVSINLGHPLRLALAATIIHSKIGAAIYSRTGGKDLSTVTFGMKSFMIRERTELFWMGET